MAVEFNPSINLDSTGNWLTVLERSNRSPVGRPFSVESKHSVAYSQQTEPNNRTQTLARGQFNQTNSHPSNFPYTAGKVNKDWLSVIAQSQELFNRTIKSLYQSILSEAQFASEQKKLKEYWHNLQVNFHELVKDLQAKTAQFELQEISAARGH